MSFPTIDRISNRIDTIKETTFIPAAYSVAQLAVSAAILYITIHEYWSIYRRYNNDWSHFTDSN